MRARNIKPGFFKCEDLAECEPMARLLFAGLWCLADRDGRLEDRPKRIKGEVFPFENCTIDDLLGQLVTNGFIVRYEVDDHKVIQVLNFAKHQRPHNKEISSGLPENPEGKTRKVSGSTGKVPGQHQNGQAGPRLPSSSCALNPSSLNPDPLIAERTGSAGEGLEEKSKDRTKTASDDDAPIPAALDTHEFRAAWAKLLAYRREKKRPMTPTERDAFFEVWVPRGPIRTAAAILESVANGYDGVVEKKGLPSRPAREDKPIGLPPELAEAEERRRNGAIANGSFKP